MPDRTLAQEMTALCADLYEAAGTHIAAPCPGLQVATQGDPVKLGICIAATALLGALRAHAEGSAALRDHVRQPGLDDVQRE